MKEFNIKRLEKAEKLIEKAADLIRRVVFNSVDDEHDEVFIEGSNERHLHEGILTLYYIRGMVNAIAKEEREELED